VDGTPYEAMDLTPELGAVAFDRNNGLIYVTEQTAGPSKETVVHVWQAPPSEAQMILYVNRSDSTCGGNSPCYVSIQASVNAAFTSQTSNSSRIRSLRVTQGTLHVKEMCISP
jgi:hypothetical protein